MSWSIEKDLLILKMMKNMKITIHSIHFSADQKLQDFITLKVERLGHYFNRIQEAHIMLKLENSGQVKDKVAEIKLHVPGDLLIVKNSSKTFENSIDAVVGTLKRRLIKYKERMQAY